MSDSKTPEEQLAEMELQMESLRQQVREGYRAQIADLDSEIAEIDSQKEAATRAHQQLMTQLDAEKRQKLVERSKVVEAMNAHNQPTAQQAKTEGDIAPDSTPSPASAATPPIQTPEPAATPAPPVVEAPPPSTGPSPSEPLVFTEEYAAQIQDAERSRPVTDEPALAPEQRAPHGTHVIPGMRERDDDDQGGSRQADTEPSKAQKVWSKVKRAFVYDEPGK